MFFSSYFLVTDLLVLGIFMLRTAVYGIFKDL